MTKKQNKKRNNSTIREDLIEPAIANFSGDNMIKKINGMPKQQFAAKLNRRDRNVEEQFNNLLFNKVKNLGNLQSIWIK